MWSSYGSLLAAAPEIGALAGHLPPPLRAIREDKVSRISLGFETAPCDLSRNPKPPMYTQRDVIGL
jgi:hypothetical protein